MFEQSIYQYTQNANQNLQIRVNNMTEADLKAKPVDQLVEDLVATYSHDAITIYNEKEHEKWEPIGKGGSDQSMRLRVPFTGDPFWFGYTHTQHPVLNLHVAVRNGFIEVDHRLSHNNPEVQIEMMRNEVRRILEEWLSNFIPAVQFHNAEIRKITRHAIEVRLARFKKSDEFLDHLASLIPLQRRDDLPAKTVLPVRRKQNPVTIESPAPTIPGTPSPKPEPQITMDAYEDILGVINSMVQVFERSPSTFATMEEEELRTILLVALNGIFNGQATGETFNGEGKNDILIRVNGANVFIAECLMWDGPAYLQGKLDDQLFRYATWRDSKLAVLIFNRKKNFTAVVQKTRQVMESHPQMVKKLPYTHPSGSRYLFKRRDDPAKEMNVTVLAFEVPD